MKVLLCLMVMLLCVSSFAGVSGSFRGTVVAGPDSSENYIYVQGHNHSVRRVDVSRAEIRYDAEVPAAARKAPVPRVLAVGTQVRVTAEQDATGEWRASAVEILQDEGGRNEKKAAPPVTSQS